ncbi:ring canal kelch-like protein [Croceivirga lutea]|uniref:Kelch repeat-containing protein n=1 Tax=Croceivirga lutea TaxID=1775167 RepID=UPI00163ACF94|nr:galactose oxidase [Croceivirga lutea]GGG50899.1 ring canal kelch-like protein [Croceivirga lutea]
MASIKQRLCGIVVIVLFIGYHHDLWAQETVSIDWKISHATIEAVARHENSFVALGDNFYLIGGRGIKPLAIYDTLTNSCGTGKEPPMEIHHFQGVAYNGKIYVIGAMTGKYPYETPVPNILIYDPKEDNWEMGAEIPKERRRGSCGVVIDGDSAFLISGIVDGHNSTHVPWTDRFDFKTQKWTVLHDAPRARDHFHAALGNGKIYAAGGRNSSYATKQTFELTIAPIDVYDVKTDTWSTLEKAHNLPTERAGCSAVYYNNNLVVLGGESVALELAHNQVEALNLETMQWKAWKPLNRGRHGTQAILHNGNIYIAAGSGKRGGRPELDSMEILVLE